MDTIRLFSLSTPLLKSYYKLSYDLLPLYFNKYIKIIEQKPVRDLCYQYIHAPLVNVYMRNVALFSNSSN